MKLKIIVFFALAPLVLFAACANLQTVRYIYSGENVLSAAAQIAREIPFESEGHFIIVPVRINGLPEVHEFILDTGAFTVIDDDLAAALGIEQPSSVTGRDSSGSDRNIGLAIASEISMGDSVVKNCGVTVFDLGRIDKLSSHRIEGLLGSNFLRFFRVTLDYRRNVVTLSANSDNADIPVNAVVLPFDSSPQYAFAPLMTGRLNRSKRIKFIVDTGAPNAVSFPSRMRGELFEQSDGRMISSVGETAGGAFGNSPSVYLLRLKNFELGSLSFENVAAVSVDLDAGLLGKEFLSKYLVTIDYPAHNLILAPYEDAVLPPDVYSTGIAVMPDASGALVVTGFWKPSPASDSGIAIGDRIVSINGRPSETLTLMNLQEMLNDTTVTNYIVVYRRGTNEIKVTLNKTGLLDYR